MSRRDLGLGAIFGAPILIFVLSVSGLVAALLEDGLWDWIGAALLASSFMTLGWVLIRRRR